MEQLWSHFIGLFTHTRETLDQLVGTYQAWTYLILFVIIFCETGLVVTPFLPGDSLLFAVGALSAASVNAQGQDVPAQLNHLYLFGLLSAAAVLGDTVNYWIGHIVGPKVFHKEKVRFLNREHLDRAHRFYEKHGGKTIILARFMPFVRTFAPFVAGIGSMTYPRFLLYNVVGGVAWIAGFLYAGHFFANLPIVQRYFHVVIAAIIVISVTPAAIEVIRHRRTR